LSSRQEDEFGFDYGYGPPLEYGFKTAWEIQQAKINMLEKDLEVTIDVFKHTLNKIDEVMNYSKVKFGERAKQKEEIWK
jgi:hypothetical protein